MSRQAPTVRSVLGRRGFSSASEICGRSFAASACQPARCGAGAYSSRSVCNLGGSRRISYVNGVCGTGCFGDFGFGGVGYGGVGGRVGLCGPRGYSIIRGYPDRKADGIQGICIDERLLKPLCVGVDPLEHEIRCQEKEQIKTLNTQFACFIDKVRFLEQQNKVLETKWGLLQQYVLPKKGKNLELYFENYICDLRKRLDCLLCEKQKLGSEECATSQLVEEFKCKYEEEINRRTTVENEFVALKKDADCIFLNKEELEVKVDLLRRQLELLKCVFEEERAQVDRQLCDTSVIVKMDNNRDLDMESIIKNVECWYQEIAQKSKEEVDAFYQTRFQELQDKRGKYCDDLQSNKCEISELTRMIQKLQCELENVKKQVSCLQTSICDVEQRGDCALKDAREKHVELQNALQKAKDELACMLRDYQELLNVKLALDIEIATYKTLLEGEESRWVLLSEVSSSRILPGDSRLPGQLCDKYIQIRTWEEEEEVGLLREQTKGESHPHGARVRLHSPAAPGGRGGTTTADNSKNTLCSKYLSRKTERQALHKEVLQTKLVSQAFSLAYYSACACDSNCNVFSCHNQTLLTSSQTKPRRFKAIYLVQLCPM
uniref:Keratin 4 n=1 Tax=Anser brachyrhynchus TaxID=132585 RepID=A0A8B9BJ57_9AVES